MALLPAAPIATGTEARVCADIARRQQMGIAKYGTTVEANPLQLREWLQHAYEEVLDLAVYLRRAIEEHDSITGHQAQAKAPSPQPPREAPPPRDYTADMKGLTE